MKKMIFGMGLPRSGSTLLSCILNQHPLIYSTGSCPLPYLYKNTRTSCVNTSEFIAMDMNTLNSSVQNFLYEGTMGWYKSQTNKPIVFSKSRMWDENLDLIFKIFENPKIIITIRDLRDIIYSFEKLQEKYAYLIPENDNGRILTKGERIDNYLFRQNTNLSRPLKQLPNVIEYMMKYPNNFFVMRFEDFVHKPNESLQMMHTWLEMENYDYDLNNIAGLDYTEHDTVYRSAVSHKVHTKLTQVKSTWNEWLTFDESNDIIKRTEWYYNFFYSDKIRGETL